MLNKTLQAANNDYSREDFENLIEMFGNTRRLC